MNLEKKFLLNHTDNLDVIREIFFTSALKEHKDFISSDFNLTVPQWK